MALPRLSHVRDHPLSKWVALACTALVLALGIAAVNPTAHAWFHEVDASSGHGDDACAVMLFANGLPLGVGPIALTPPVSLNTKAGAVRVAVVSLVAPRYLRQPERGPPAT